jgi:hypothetical protein
MRKNTLLKSLAVLTLAWHAPSYASFSDPTDSRFDMGHHIAENSFGFLPIPILITEPAVGIGGGLMGMFMHETEEEKEKRKTLAMNSVDGGAQLMPAAITLVGAAGTKNGTWLAFAGHRHSWLSDSIRYTGGIGLGQANLAIYKEFSFGGGSQTLQFGTETMGIGMLQKLEFRIAQTPLMLGIKQVASISAVHSDNKWIDKLMAVTLGKDSITSGLGITADYDTRNNIFFPTEGYAVGLEYMVYDENIGSDSNYQNLVLNGEGYIPVAQDWTLAFAGNYQAFNSEDNFLSPTAQPYVKLRGVSSYRFQGDNVVTLQSQVTYDIDHRWTVSGFYGVGMTRTENRYEVAKEDRVDAYGAGFRYQIARRYGLHIGVDVAFSDEEQALYFNLGSGF